MITKNAVLTLLGDRPIAYHPILAKKLGGVEVAVFVSQLLYWTGRGKLAGGWIFKTQAEFEAETGLSRRNQETARKKLKKLMVLEEKLQGVPATLHYRLNLDVLAAILDDEPETENEQTGMAEPDELDCTDRTNQYGGMRQTRMAESYKHHRLHTETTPEITQNNDSPQTPQLPPDPHLEPKHKDLAAAQQLYLTKVSQQLTVSPVEVDKIEDALTEFGWDKLKHAMTVAGSQPRTKLRTPKARWDYALGVARNQMTQAEAEKKAQQEYDKRMQERLENDPQYQWFLEQERIQEGQDNGKH